MKRVIEMQTGCRRCQGDGQVAKVYYSFLLGADSTKVRVEDDKQAQR